MTAGEYSESPGLGPGYAHNVALRIVDGQPVNGVYYDSLILSGPGVQEQIDFDAEFGMQRAAYLHFPDGDPQTRGTTEGLLYGGLPATEYATTELRNLVLGLHVSKAALAGMNPRTVWELRQQAAQLELTKQKAERLAWFELSGRRRDERIKAIRALTPQSVETTRCVRAAAPLSMVALYDVVVDADKPVTSERRLAVLYHSSLSEPQAALRALQNGAKRLGWAPAGYAA